MRDTRYSRPIEVAVHVERVFDARFVLSGHLGRNLPIDMGRSAVLRHGNVHIVATSRSGPHFAPELFLPAGLTRSPPACWWPKVRAAFARRMPSGRPKSCWCNRPAAPADFWNYPYANIDRPLWPWDELPEWRAAPQVLAVEATVRIWLLTAIGCDRRRIPTPPQSPPNRLRRSRQPARRVDANQFRRRIPRSIHGAVALDELAEVVAEKVVRFFGRR